MLNGATSDYVAKSLLGTSAWSETMNNKLKSAPEHDIRGQETARGPTDDANRLQVKAPPQPLPSSVIGYECVSSN
jgi:hypothetical protein